MNRYPDKFPIGFWNYTKTGDLGPDAVKDWVDLGMTFAHSPRFDPTKHNKQDMLDILNACQKYDIPVIMDDFRCAWIDASEDADGYSRRFREAVEDFGNHKAVMGFHVGDEPMNDKAIADSAAAHKLQLEIAPHLIPHLNLLPYWPGQEETILKAPFQQWVKDYNSKADLKILCYDCYAQMNPGEEGFDTYYQNLRMFSQSARETGTIPWTTLLSVGHFRYRPHPFPYYRETERIYGLF